MSQRGNFLNMFSVSQRLKLTLALSVRWMTFKLATLATTVGGPELVRYDRWKGLLPPELLKDIVIRDKYPRVEVLHTAGSFPGLRLYLRPDGSDLDVFLQIFVAEEYRPILRLVEDARQTETIRYIVDAGANVGFTSVYLKKFFPDARIVAIEPDKSNFVLLQENVLLNGLADVETVQAGLWSENTKLELDAGFRDSREWAIAVRERAVSENHSKSIDGLTLATLCERFDLPKIDILKIDIEGGERFLFQDEVTASATLRNVHFLALEIHDEFVIRDKIRSLLTLNQFSYEEEGETLFAARIHGA